MIASGHYNDGAVPMDPGHQRLVLWPHRSASTGVTLTLLSVIAAGLAVPIAGIAGFAAWPLVVPASATVAGVALAFWCNNRAARFHEVIDVSPGAIRIERIGPVWARSGVEFNPHWVRLTVETDFYLENRITLRECGRSYSPGVFLAPEERRSLAEALREGMRNARNAD